jgi:carboxyl-terminal processing protease
LDEDGVSEFVTLDVISETRDVITVRGEMFDDIGYIKITSFNEKTPQQLHAALAELTAQGATAVVFDLRNNGGGLVDALTESLEGIVGEGDIITAYYRNSEETVVAAENPEKLKLPVVVIVNGWTASSAELFALALRDMCGAQIVGSQSYGKGVMQTIYKLSNGGAVKITVATLQTEKSGDYNGTGIKPHFEVSLPLDVDINALEGDDRLLYDLQLTKALDVAVTIR